MTPPLAAFAFLVSLLAMLGAAQLFAGRLDRLGLSLGLPEALLGLLTALAADSPEVASAVAALVRGEHDVAVGVVVGSNAFNIAAMLGVSAIVAVGIRARRESVVIEGFVGLWVTGVMCVLLAGGIGAALGLALIALVVVPYVVLLAVGPRGVRRRHVPVVGHFLRRSFGEGHMAPRKPPSREEALLRLLLLLLLDLVVIVGSSSLLVASSVDLANAWGIPHAVLGVLVLAVLTSLPNAVTGVRFGLRGRGSALVSETLNSNSINLIVGIAIPAAIVSLGTLGNLGVFDVAWLVVMTVVALALFARRGGVGRGGGILLVLLYGVFVVVQVLSLT
jgi:cation:H+ antiporter